MNPEQTERVKALMTKLSQSPQGRDLMQNALNGAGFKMTRLATFEGFPTCTDPDRLAQARTGIVMDTETTGLEFNKDEVVELAMVRFRFDDQGILALDEVYNKFREPSLPISEEATKITGITNEMVSGHKISDEEVRSFIGDAELIVAHNAQFDRKMMEYCFPKAGLDKIDWHCSFKQIDWELRGMKRAALENLILKADLSYGSHRADADAIATAYALNAYGGAFTEMVEFGERPTLQVIMKGAPFDAKDMLKDNKFIWCPGNDEAYGYKAWHREIPDTPEARAEMIEIIQKAYGKEMSVPMFIHDARTRYSGVNRPSESRFDTKDIANMTELGQAMRPDRDTSQPGLF